MSISISVCQICKAALGDEEAFDSIAEAMEYNLRWGVWSTYPCKCDPPCLKPSDEQLEKFNERMKAAILNKDNS